MMCLAECLFKALCLEADEESWIQFAHHQA